ncbi:DUF6431 domain-containing protein [Fuchsiella alkaliacetigena]|uniref:DUF6431 domain-containing protein n=1 Tax=Fuchsiella alkaliacetigena TaxID=957042 RepID=UPI00200A070B|nr:DUF6431 domain-containing protein [Fuchsiella alkaliacetigena]MCK8824811.1 DUF6431 domain-containing protein [Fuchsiella alkaliacetigena]
MQVIHDFNISIQDYVANGQDNDFPLISKCSLCGDLMIKNGFYQRFVITYFTTYIIFIRRYRCKHCGVSVSVLPSFLLPHFQRSLKCIFLCIKEYLFTRKLLLYPSALFFYLKRFIKNIPAMISFFRESIYSFLVFKGSKYEKAIKLIKMIMSSPTHTFSQRFFTHFNISFMAL